MTCGPVTFPAFQFLKELSPVKDALNRDGCLRGNVQRSPGLAVGPARRPCLDKRNQVGALLWGQGGPGRHVRRHEATGHCVIEVFIGRQCAGWRRTTLESSLREVPGFGVYPSGIHSLAVAVLPMAANTIPSVKALTARRVSSQGADMALFGCDVGCAERRIW